MSNASQNGSAAILRVNDRLYSRFADSIQGNGRSRKPELLLRNISRAARFAALFHSGRFADGAIENPAFEIGASLNGVRGSYVHPMPERRRAGGRRVLHVVSEVGGVGGHTRMLHYWIQNDRSSHHALAVANQRGLPVPEWMAGAMKAAGQGLYVLPEAAPVIEKARWLREAARRTADLVIVHHYPWDVTPTVAFAHAGGPPVLVLNHADHSFWLGSSAADGVIDLRSVATRYTCTRRAVERSVLLPVPLTDSFKGPSRAEARRVLGIDDGQVALLSVARPEKFRPYGPYDFPGTMGKILERHPQAHMYVVGESEEGIAPYLRQPLHPRLHFVGVQEDTSLYRAAADLYLETFPFGTQTGLLEAALAGVAVVPAYAPLFPLLVANDDALCSLIPNPESEQEHMERANALIQDAARRREEGAALRSALLRGNVGEAWMGRLEAVYRAAEGLEHRPAPIPVSQCRPTADDINLSLWHAMADGRRFAANLDGSTEGAQLRHAAGASKYVGCYGAARRYALAALVSEPKQKASWSLAATVMAGAAGPLIHRVLRRFRDKRAR
ncbi:MAG: hypothetical protein ACM336_03155 [Acidobacteriota bacterium]